MQPKTTTYIGNVSILTDFVLQALDSVSQIPDLNLSIAHRALLLGNKRNQRRHPHARGRRHSGRASSVRCRRGRGRRAALVLVPALLVLVLVLLVLLGRHPAGCDNCIPVEIMCLGRPSVIDVSLQWRSCVRHWVYE